ncbi:hypothetical protein [Streptomyces sp. NPDC048845]|uniref:hypothetical protein n=1 Tax=Streptomyces sp. NPDC048845 TaxID=3155390 RepID=UPI003416F4A8
MRQELLSLPKTLAEDVARNLVMVAKLLDDDPEQAYAYSRIALRLASRVPAVREAAGFAAYGTGKYAEALAEFRAARRMTGSAELWPVMADCERGMGRPERALAMAGEPEVQKLDKAGQVEMRLVAAGARRDMGQTDAAVVTLQSPELASHSVQPWTARLRYAYADALLAVGREDEAREWFAKALEADQGGTTDASDRLAELDGVEFLDAFDPEAEAEEQQPAAAEDSDAGTDLGASADSGSGSEPDSDSGSDSDSDSDSGSDSDSDTGMGTDAGADADSGSEGSVAAGSGAAAGSGVVAEPEADGDKSGPADEKADGETDGDKSGPADEKADGETDGETDGDKSGPAGNG